MSSGISVICFAASYTISLGLELWGVWASIRWRRFAVIGTTAAGIVAHTWYLAHRVKEMPSAPLSSQHDWYLTAAWALAIIYLAAVCYYPRSTLGLFLMPATLALIAAAQFASMTPLATFQAPRFWGLVHGVLLLVGTLAVLIGFLTGTMYLLQSYRLKHKLLPGHRVRLPSLEWLGRSNSRCLGIATMCVGGGFFAGLVSRLARQEGDNLVPWNDPVVMSLTAMFAWLLLAEVFRLVYPSARQGRKVAYLTVAAILFLLLVLLNFNLSDSLHQAPNVEPTIITTGLWQHGGVR